MSDAPPPRPPPQGLRRDQDSTVGHRQLQQPPQQGNWRWRPQKRRQKWPFIVGAIVLCLIVLAVAASLKSTKKTATSSDTTTATADVTGPKAAATPTTTAATSATSFAPTTSGITAAPTTATRASGSKASHTVGQTDHTGDLTVTLDTVTDPYIPSNPVEKPPAGQHFVGVEMTITCTKQHAFSPYLSVALDDPVGHRFTPTIAGTDLTQLTGDISPGSPLRGWVFYLVPDGTTGLKMRVKSDFRSTGTVFALH